MKNSTTNPLADAYALMKPFVDLQIHVNPSCSQRTVYDGIVITFLKQRIAWEELSEKELMELSLTDSCFIENQSRIPWQKHILSLKRFSNETIFAILEEDRWLLLNEELAQAIHWETMSEEEAIEFCDSFSKRRKEVWQECYNNVTFSKKGLLVMAQKCPFEEIKNLVLKRIEEELEPA